MKFSIPDKISPRCVANSSQLGLAHGGRTTRDEATARSARLNQSRITFHSAGFNSRAVIFHARRLRFSSSLLLVFVFRCRAREDTSGYEATGPQTIGHR